MALRRARGGRSGGQHGQHLHLRLGGLSAAERAEVMGQLLGGQPGG
jgi:hypothetical protein